MSIICYLLSPISVSASLDARVGLASSLYESGDYNHAALEYRRIAADIEPGSKSLSGLYLAAAEAYCREGAWDRMGRMMDRAHDEGASGEATLLFLRAAHAEGTRNWSSAADYSEELAAALSNDSRISEWACRKASADYLRAGDDASARETASRFGGAPIVDAYLAGRDRSPRIGGLLGIVPGLGYAYSGEWGNMVRSMVLNGLFGWAMFECADHDRWGLFAVTTFFELTWYSGSIYGGIDAAHRYNANRLETAARELDGVDSPLVKTENRLGIISVSLEF